MQFLEKLLWTSTIQFTLVYVGVLLLLYQSEKAVVSREIFLVEEREDSVASYSDEFVAKS